MSLFAYGAPKPGRGWPCGVRPRGGRVMPPRAVRDGRPERGGNGTRADAARPPRSGPGPVARRRRPGGARGRPALAGGRRRRSRDRL